jgi:hypothetical protein
MITQRPQNLIQSLYGNNTQFYYGLWDNSSTKVLSALVNEPGPGLQCVNRLHLKTYDKLVFDKKILLDKKILVFK